MELKCINIRKNLRSAKEALAQALEDGVLSTPFRDEVSRLEAELELAVQDDVFDYILALEPDLNLNGFRMPADSNSLHEGLRQDLWGHRGAFDACRKLLLKATRPRFPRDRCSSLGLCQAIEVSTDLYIPHGAVIAAAMAVNIQVDSVPFAHYAIIGVDRQWMMDLIWSGEEARLRNALARSSFGAEPLRSAGAPSYRAEGATLALVSGGSQTVVAPEPDDEGDVF